MGTAGPISGAQLARHNNDPGHVLTQSRVWWNHFRQFLNLSESNQFQAFLQDRRAQRPKVSVIIVMSMHEIADVRILRMIIDLSLDGDITTELEVLETSPQRK